MFTRPLTPLVTHTSSSKLGVRDPRSWEDRERDTCLPSDSESLCVTERSLRGFESIRFYYQLPFNRKTPSLPTSCAYCR